MFTAGSIELHGALTVTATPDRAFGLFSPLGEKLWVPGWNPEMLHPPNASWEKGLIFRTRVDAEEAVWIVTSFDLDGHEVEYYRVEPGRYVARVHVRCEPHGEGHSRVHVSYGFVGLSDAGNRAIGAMSQSEYEAKMKQWEEWIRFHYETDG